ncbi:ppg3-related protein-like protein [Leishmania major strain Friedlin]|uniref:Ppg3-related protein-like protein n=1 Tax=Leishmania major TaxID=5664 RepID=Q4QAU3_LEIMA|nr:ppg3-related protein-like protein [Leishmania major strain Friedlin]CAG9574504.1 ppg3-related_protein-like_protein [Leishmania major strain Friedlin]CAJ04200.1 ppg3-related protein-like protein [Leishmania major strain Friedlin]|eukprot:XP_001683555.1 ppg3-related protein-like protein [Leishmania major strain Friedlin]
MLQDQDRSRRAKRKHAQTSSSFDRWLERTQRRGAGAHGSGVDHRSYMDDGCHVDPQSIGRAALGHRSSHAPLPWSPVLYPISPPGQHSRLEDLEARLLMQGHYNHLFPAAAARDEVGYNAISAPQVAPASRTLDMPPSDAASSHSCGGVAYSLGGTVDGIAKDGGRSVAIGGPLFLSTPHRHTQEVRSRCALPSGGTDATGVISAAEVEAERYIARLEEEVQTLMMEISDKDRCIVLISAAKEAMAVQLQEQMTRGDLISDESATRQMLSYNFMRRVAFHKTQAESNLALELNTQISVLKYELKLAETMLAQSQSSATAAASQHQQQLLKEKKGEDELARSFSATLRSLLQDEYDRLAQLVSEMPSKVQMIMSASGSTPRGEGDNAAKDAVALQQRRLHELLESLLASRGGAAASPSPPPLKDADSSHLVGLVSSVCRHHAAMTDIYCAEADRKAALAQYEGDIVRLISAKQSVLTWATLYQEKKDEVKHLKEKIMSLRAELRAAQEQSRRVVSSGPSAGGGVGSAISTQRYEAYAAPYVPASAKLRRSSRDAPESSSISPQMKPRAAAIKMPIGVLREEARRLGALPASYYWPLVRSASPSMGSLSASSSPAKAERRLRIQDRKHEASGKRGGSEEAVAASAVVEVLTVVSSSSHACSPAVSASQAAPRQLESGGTSPSAPSPRAALPRTEKAQRSAAQSQPRVRGRRQRSQTTSQKCSSRTALSSSSSSSRQSKVLPAARALKVATLKRVFAAEEASSLDSSSSASSLSVLSHTKPQRAAAKPTAATATQQPRPKALHNSFDDADSGSSDAGAATVPEGTFDALHRRSTSKLAATGASAKAAVSSKTISSAAAASENPKKHRAKVGGGDDASSANVSMTSLSSVPVKTTVGGLSTSARTIENKGTSAASAKPTHMRRSSFDEDDSDDGAEDSSSSSDNASATPVPAPRARVGSSTARASTAAAKPSAERRSVSATTNTTPSTSRLGEATSKILSAKPTKLKLPTW